jgi:sRNA-binding protein
MKIIRHARKLILEEKRREEKRREEKRRERREEKRREEKRREEKRREEKRRDPPTQPSFIESVGLNFASRN